MGIGGCVYDDLLHKLMQDMGCQFRDFCVLSDNGQKPFHIGTLAFLLLDFFPEAVCLGLQGCLLCFIVSGQFLEPFVCQFARDIVLIQMLEDSIQLRNPFLCIGQELLLFGKALASLLLVHIHDHLHKLIFLFPCIGNNLTEILQYQFFQNDRQYGMGGAAYIPAFPIPRTQIILLLPPEAGCPALVHD